MKKKILSLVLFIFISLGMAFGDMAKDIHHDKIPPKPTYKQIKEFDKMLDDRLKFTKEQKEFIKENRVKYRREMQKIVSKMEDLHDKIRNVYLTGIPPFQANIRTAGYKAELVLLKQNADKLKNDNKKAFENILTQEQKIEFEKIKKEYQEKKDKKCIK